MDNKKKGIGIFIAAIFVILVFAAVAIAAQESSDKAPTSESTLGSSGDSSWDVLFQHDVQTPTDDNQCLGVEFDGTFFWVTGGGGTTHPVPNKLHKFDKDGNYITSYNQPTVSDWGWRDLVWDGNYLYGSDSPNIEQIDPATGTPTGGVTIPGPLDPNRGLAYDPATDHFWTADFSSDIYEIDRGGTIINQFPNSLSIYGLAWDDISPDGPWLWIWSQDGNGCLCSQFDPRTGLFTGLTYDGAVPPDGIAGGACFARFGNIGVFVGLHQATPDTIVGYEITMIPAPVPTLTPIGIIALVGLISVVAAISIGTSIRKKRR